jgi:hypothetical protein
MVEHFTHNHKIKGLNPAGIWREKMAKKVALVYRSKAVITKL